MTFTTRALLMGAIAAALLVPADHIAVAGPGHDHGAETNAAPTGPASPRLVAESETYELVGILKDGTLTLYLDRREDTSPVTDARIELTVDTQSGIAEPKPDGTYTYASDALNKHGDREVVAVISATSGDDLLVGTLKDNHDHEGHDHGDGSHSAPKPDASENIAAHPHAKLPAPIANTLKNVGIPPAAIDRRLANGPLLAGVALAFGILMGALIQGRTAIVAGLIGLIAVFGAGAAWAGPGHDHGHDAPAAASNGDAPRRLPDGTLFLPKPTQRLLEIRTRILKSETARSTTRLIGRVISDPNSSGLVQSTIGGRLTPAKAGLPVLGQRVKAGQILAYVEPAFAPIDASDVRQTAGDLKQKIALLKARIARQQRLVDKQVASRANLQDLEIELTGLEARQRELLHARNTPEALKAPVDGVIAEMRVSAGQVVASADTLFHIVDPNSLWVEAISFDPRLKVSGTSAQARTSDDELFDLTFVGRSRALQQQATVLQFRVDSPTEALSIGSPVKVLVETGTPVTGLIIPRAAIAQAPNGQMVAFARQEPERYNPKPVRLEDIDAERVLITGGLEPGDQIIVRNAPLVNQIR